MTLPICPVCGRAAVEVNLQETHAAAQSIDKSGVEVVVCHCTESHRFVVSPNELVQAAGSLRSGNVPR